MKVRTRVKAGAEIDEVREELGDIKFDQLFGSASSQQNEKIPAGSR